MITCKHLSRLMQDDSLYQLRAFKIVTGLRKAPAWVIKRWSFSLTCLDVSGYPQIHEEYMGHILINSQSLNVVNMAGCYNLGNKTLGSIANLPGPVYEINISRCPLITGNGLLSFMRKDGNFLEKLVMQQCNGMRKERHLLALIGNYMPVLEHFSVRGDKTPSEVYPWTSSEIERVLRKNPPLKYLDISYCLVISAGTMSQAARCSELIHLHLRRCYITNQSLDSIGRGLSKLIFLDIGENYLITDQGLSHLTNCPRLTHLDLTDCPNVSDRGIKLIQKSCGKLKSLILTVCDNLTDDSIRLLPFYCRHLELLDISCNTYVTFRTVKSVLLRAHSKLKIRAKHCPLVIKPENHSMSRSEYLTQMQVLEFAYIPE
ncbi:F-box/LRR-repeat protein 20-like [Ptychodera flava]|uniref:F-box/LRR-repeat protein 20-like n=1 Tax=Ptychodera flava TaxID=63121 RepID=UPI00396A4703